MKREQEDQLLSNICPCCEERLDETELADPTRELCYQCEDLQNALGKDEETPHPTQCPRCGGFLSQDELSEPGRTICDDCEYEKDYEPLLSRDELIQIYQEALKKL